jgi:hypothetical protein
MQGTVEITISAGGISIQSVVTRTQDAGIPPQEIAVAAAKAGTLSTRTNDTAGTLTMAANHGITNAAKIDIGWNDSSSDFQACYGATVGTVSNLSVPFTGAAGTVLPTENATIAAQVRLPQNVAWDNDDGVLLGFMSTRNGHVVFEDSGNNVLKAQRMRASEACLYWDEGFMANPITGNAVEQLQLTNLDSANAATFKLCGLYDPSP